MPYIFARIANEYINKSQHAPLLPADDLSAVVPDGLEQVLVLVLPGLHPAPAHRVRRGRSRHEPIAHDKITREGSQGSRYSCKLHTHFTYYSQCVDIIRGGDRLTAAGCEDTKTGPPGFLTNSIVAF